MDVLLWVGGPKDGQPVTAEDMTAITQNLKAGKSAYDALLQERDALKAALHALVMVEPIDYGPSGRNPSCMHCGGPARYRDSWSPPGGGAFDVDHAPGCAWVKARKVLGVKGEE